MCARDIIITQLLRGTEHSTEAPGTLVFPLQHVVKGGSKDREQAGGRVLQGTSLWTEDATCFTSSFALLSILFVTKQPCMDNVIFTSYNISSTYF